MGPQLVRHLEGSEHAKERLEVILATIAGELTIHAACERLGIGEAMFHRLRKRVLQVGLADLEPRVRGRPSPQPTAMDRENERLSQRIESLESELKLSEIRQELSVILPHFASDDSPSDPATTVKKTKSRRKKLRQQRQKRRRR